jgi:hypothetical protein
MDNMMMMRPNVEMSRHISEVSAAETEADAVKADFCDGLILAADSLHRQISISNDTSYNESRRLLILTDACSPVHSLNAEQMQLVLE